MKVVYSHGLWRSQGADEMMALQNRVVSSSPLQPKQVAVLCVATPSKAMAGTSLGFRSCYNIPLSHINYIAGT